MKFLLKENLLLGSATAATQIEGGDENNNWARFAKEGKVKDGTSPVRACNHYELWREDIDLMAEMGLQVYRFGIEWSRVEPKYNKFDEDALAHYREEIEYMLSRGIRPLLTLHHFSNPLWFEERGSWESKHAVDLFMNYVQKVVSYLGDLVDEYITINEPNVYALNGYFYGEWPPQRKSLRAYSRVLSNFTEAHIRAYNHIHTKRKAMGKEHTLVSFANHLRVFEPKNKKNIIHRFASSSIDWLFQGAITKAMMTGKCTFPVHRRKTVNRGKYYDFIGVNYYTRSTISGFSDGTRADAFHNDLGWEIYHNGLIEISEKLYNKYKAPVFVTENGTCDLDDSFRPRFIYDQLKLISEVENHIERYYHWTFIDNFEWKEGESARFGLVRLNFGTQERTINNSGRFYSSIIENQGVTEDAYEQFVENSEYHE